MNNKSKTGGYYVERLNDKNLADVEKLHNTVYGKAPVISFFKKYDTAFTAVKHIGFIAYDNLQLPIAFYAVVPCFIQFNEKIILAAQSSDTMTHPGYRNKGLFIELALLTFQLCRAEGIKLLFGFPNQNSLPGFVNKLGWQRTGTLDCFIINSAIFSWERVFRKIKILKSLYTGHQQKQIKKYLLPQNGIDNSVFEDEFAGVYRDYHYLNYKTYSNTDVIKIGNSTLWVKISDVLLIGDIAVTPDDFDDMIYKLKKLTNKLGIKEIHFHASPGTTLHNLFAIRFNSIPSFPVIFNDFGGDIPIEKIIFTSADIDTF
jgi:hypothetical protein